MPFRLSNNCTFSFFFLLSFLSLYILLLILLSLSISSFLSLCLFVPLILSLSFSITPFFLSRSLFHSLCLSVPIVFSSLYFFRDPKYRPLKKTVSVRTRGHSEAIERQVKSQSDNGQVKRNIKIYRTESISYKQKQRPDAEKLCSSAHGNYSSTRTAITLPGGHWFQFRPITSTLLTVVLKCFK
jgi:hypothetical protein